MRAHFCGNGQSDEHCVSVQGFVIDISVGEGMPLRGWRRDLQVRSGGG